MFIVITLTETFLYDCVKVCHLNKQVKDKVIIKVIKQRTIRWTEHVACMGAM